MDLLPRLYVKFDGVTALGVLRRSRVAAVLRSLLGVEQRSTASGGNGGAQVEVGRDHVQGERDPISAGAMCGYSGRALIDST